MSLTKILLNESMADYTNGSLITLYHYTETDKNTLILQPDKFGQHSFTRADKRATDYPRVFFYLDLDDTERFFKNDNYTLYSTTVLSSSVYDVLKDPDGIKADIREHNNGALNFDDLLGSIHSSGYKGMYYKPKGEIVIWFEPIEVMKHVEEVVGAEAEVHQLPSQDIISIFSDNEVAILSAERGMNTAVENSSRSLKLKKDLKQSGYQFTEAFGGYVETDDDGNKMDVEEKSFMVWADHQEKGEFIEDMIELGRKYNQESILIKESDEQQAYFIGTTNSNYLSFGEKDYIGEFRPNQKSQYFTRIGSFYFVFGDAVGEPEIAE